MGPIEVAWESTRALMPLVFWFFAHKECCAQLTDVQTQRAMDWLGLGREIRG